MVVVCEVVEDDASQKLHVTGQNSFNSSPNRIVKLQRVGVTKEHSFGSGTPLHKPRNLVTDSVVSDTLDIVKVLEVVVVELETEEVVMVCVTDDAVMEDVVSTHVPHSPGHRA